METSRTTYIGQGATGLAADARFVDKIHACVTTGFGRPDFDKEDTRYHLQADYVDIAMDGHGKIVGFLSAKFGKASDMLPGIDLGENGNKNVAYLFGTAVAPEFKGNGLYKELASDFIRESLGRGFTTFLFSTQNPQVEAGFDKALNHIAVNMSVEKQRIPIPVRYGRLLTGEMPRAVSEIGIQHAYEKLRRNAGDAYAVIYTLEDAKRR